MARLQRLCEFSLKLYSLEIAAPTDFASYPLNGWPGLVFQKRATGKEVDHDSDGWRRGVRRDGYLLRAYLLNSPRLRLASPADVVVEGSHYVSREEVLAALGVQAGAPGRGANIFRTSLDEREKQVESIPWVRAATV